MGRYFKSGASHEIYVFAIQSVRGAAEEGEECEFYTAESGGAAQDVFKTNRGCETESPPAYRVGVSVFEMYARGPRAQEYSDCSRLFTEEGLCDGPVYQVGLVQTEW